jgi:DNA invertase Pin-like site-specific DNA recombinase
MNLNLPAIRKHRGNRTPSVPQRDQSLGMIYTRVSTQEQGTRFSLESQLEAIKRKAAADGVRIPDEFVFVDTFSGKVASRPDFDRMNALIEKGPAGRVYAFSVDRFARDTADALMLHRKYMRCGVKLDIVNAHIDDTPIGRFTFAQLASFAQLWGDMIHQNTMDGNQRTRKAGRMTHGNAPYGYKYLDKNHGQRFELDPRIVYTPSNWTAADVVRQIYAWRAADWATNRIWKALNEMGIPSPGRRLPATWCRQTVITMLQNPTYMGKHVIGADVLNCPVIVPEPLWSDVQKVRRDSAQRHNGRPASKSLLSSYIFCKRCQCRMTGCRKNVDGKVYEYYLCNSIHSRSGELRCKGPHLKRKYIDNLVFSEVWALLTQPELAIAMAEQHYQAKLAALPTDSINTLEAKIVQLEKRQDTINRMVEAGMRPFEEGKEAWLALADDIKQMRHQVDLMRRGRDAFRVPTLKDVQANLAEFQGKQPSESFEDRRQVLDEIGNFKVVCDGEELEIHGNLTERAGKSVTNGLSSLTLSIPFKITKRIAA